MDQDLSSRPSPTMHFTLGESIELAHALVADVADHKGVRALFIKGLSLNWHGLRPARIPSDVDVLVPPDQAEALVQALEPLGWRPRLSVFHGSALPHHSVSLFHDHWPCDIDVHSSYPGFLVGPELAFDLLWDTRQDMPVAAGAVPVTGFAGGVLVLALHSARSTPDDPRHAIELKHLIEVSAGWSAESREEVAALAASTGASRALAEVLPRMGVEVREPTAPVSPAAEAEWWRRIHGRTSTGTAWLRHVFTGSPLRWPRRLFEAAWPPEDAFRAGHLVAPGRKALNEARRQRLSAGLRRLPGALLRTIGLNRRNVLDDADL